MITLLHLHPEEYNICIREYAIVLPVYFSRECTFTVTIWSYCGYLGITLSLLDT